MMRSSRSMGAWTTSYGAGGLLLLALLVGCDKQESAKPDPAAAGSTKVEIVRAAEGGEAVEAVVKREMDRAGKDGRNLVVYVGATWCEPCERFKEAAKRGELDGEFPTLRMLEFDRDRDEARLEKAGCISQLIPLFAKPTDAGRCDPKLRVMGGIKGPKTVRHIADRLKRMLASG